MYAFLKIHMGMFLPEGRQGRWPCPCFSGYGRHSDWGKAGHSMKAKQLAGRCILAGLFVYLMFQIYYLACNLLPLAAGKTLRGVICLFLAQSVLFEVIILSVFLFSFLRYRKEKSASPFASFVVISGEGKIKDEIMLQDKLSLMITRGERGKDVSLESGGEAGAGRYLYAVCKLVSGCWYIEASPGDRPVGLRKGGAGMVYRLKAGVPYLLSQSDVIYADTCKIIVRQQKFLEGSKWV